MPTAAPRLTLCLIARDEERLLGACLASVRGVVDEIVVVDTGSTDGTTALARQHGATVILDPWEDDFSRPRNRALAHASGEWILVLDADERLTPAGGRELRRVLRTERFDCGFLPLVHAASLDAAPEAVVAGTARRDEPVLLPRLFRRTPDLRWEGVIHESVGRWLGRDRRSVRVECPIVHFGNVPELRRERGKAGRNLRLLERRAVVEPTNPVVRAWLARELWRADRREEAREAIERAWQDLCRAPEDHARVPVVTLLATLRLAAGEAEAALDALARAAELGARHPNLDYLEARCHLHLGHDPARAEAALRRCLDRQGELFVADPVPGATSWAAWTALGELCLRTGRHEEARQWLDRALAVRPGDLPAALTTAELDLATGRAAAALERLQPRLASAPMDGWLLAATAALDLRRPDEARQLLDQARRLGASPVVAPHRRALEAAAEARLAGHDTLVGIAGGVVPRPATAAPVLVAAGEEAFHRGALDEAASAFLQALADDDRLSMAWLDLGVTLLAAGAVEPGEQVLEAGRRICPADADLACNLARHLAATGHPERAARVLRELGRAGASTAEAQGLLRQVGATGPRGPEVLVVEETGLDGLLAEMGIRPRPAAEDVVRALAATGVSDPVGLLLDLGHPDAVLARAPCAWTRAAEVRGIPVLDPAQVTPLTLARTVADRHEPARPDHPPLLSVIVPTYERHDCLENLLDRLALQDLEPGLFEVVVVDDGSPRAVEAVLGPQVRPYRLAVVRQPNAGPAAARNRALGLCRGRWLLILNDDALPALDNLRRHLVGQALAPGPEALLGSFDFVPEARRRPFVELLGTGSRLFEYELMTPGELHSWRFFYTCNLSVPREDVEAVGGFDAAGFPRAICEDSELGLRLERDRRIRVRYDPTITAEHDHVLDVDGFCRRAFRLGYYHHRLWSRHRVPGLTWATGTHDPELESTWNAVRAVGEFHAEAAARALLAARDLERLVPRNDEQKARVMDLLKPLVTILQAQECRRGQVHAQMGWSDDPTPPRRRLAGELTSVVIPNLDGMPHLAWCVESLRRHTDGPTELIVVDNGSTDGSLAWLREQPDLHLVELGGNHGAPYARNRGLERATGQSIVLCNNDVLFTPGWREILLGHLEAWPDVGLVGPLTDVVVGPQKIEARPRKKDDLDRFARRWHTENAGRHHYTKRLILFFMALRREVVEAVGGIDEAFSPWGFEDDDYTVRAAIAGFKLRIADDCYVRHLGSRTNGARGLDYAALLLRNWETFKAKWGMDPAIPMGEPYEPWVLAQRSFDPARHRCALSPLEPAVVRLLGPPRGLPPGVPKAPREPLRAPSADSPAAGSVPELCAK